MPKSVSKKEKAYQAIKHAIIFGQLEPAMIYSIADLSETFKLGKMPAREALVILASEGLIDPIPRSGYQVKPISVQDLMEIFHLRSVLEVEAVGLAAARITEEDIKFLEENNLQERGLAKSLNSSEMSKYRKGFDLNLKFHTTIARSSGNMRLVNLVENLLYELERVFVQDPLFVEPYEHEEILDELKKRNKLGAQKIMEKHLEVTKKRTLDRF